MYVAFFLARCSIYCYFETNLLFLNKYYENTSTTNNCIISICTYTFTHTHTNTGTKQTQTTSRTNNLLEETVVEFLENILQKEIKLIHNIRCFHL